MKKKWIAGMMSAALIAGMALPVYASQTDTKSLYVKYEEPSTFTMSIPQDVTLSKESGTTGTIELSAINVAANKKVEIRVTEGITDGKVTLTDENDTNNTCSATVSLEEGGTGVDPNAPIAEFTNASPEPLTVTLYFSALGNDITAGTYKGTITYQGSIVNK